MNQHRRGDTKVILIVLLVVAASIVLSCVCSGILAVLLPMVQQAQEAERRQEASENLKRIGDALHAYHQEAEAMPHEKGGLGVPVDGTSGRNASDNEDQ